MRSYPDEFEPYYRRKSIKKYKDSLKKIDLEKRIQKKTRLSICRSKKESCVLVFDEADVLFAKRFYETYNTDRMHNYMTNILMRELERFDGVIILTTNREVVIDEAFDRRIILKLKFDIPKPKERQ